MALLAGGGQQSYKLALLTAFAPGGPLAAPASTTALAAPLPLAAFEPELIVTPVSPVFEGLVTHYGAQYDGSRMGCAGDAYSSLDPAIIAVGAYHEGEWPCGTNLRVCGPAGCLVGVRQDGCPGCGPYHLDLSEAGINLICGDQAHVCRAGIEQVVLELPEPQPDGFFRFD